MVFYKEWKRENRNENDDDYDDDDDSKNHLLPLYMRG